jgi:hypothetical protein
LGSPFFSLNNFENGLFFEFVIPRRLDRIPSVGLLIFWERSLEPSLRILANSTMDEVATVSFPAVPRAKEIISQPKLTAFQAF